MKTDLSIEERRKIANEILPYLKQNPELYQPKRAAAMYHVGKSWRVGATASQELKKITISELMELSDLEILDLEKKVLTAKKAKEIKKRTESYNSRF